MQYGSENAKQFYRLIDRWEETGRLLEVDFQELLRLAETDERLNSAFAALQPLLERDREAARAPSTGSIMSLVRGAGPTAARLGSGGRVGTGREHSALRLWRLAAAAFFLVAVGLGVLLAMSSAGAAGRVPTGTGDAAVVTIRFELAAPEAGRVAVVGDFNEWNPGRHVMEDSDGDGVWELTVELRRGRHYTYNFLVDQEYWISDPNATDVITDPFGGEKSLLSL